LLSIRLGLWLGLRLGLGYKFIFYLHLLRFYQAFCYCHLGGKILDTAFSICSKPNYMFCSCFELFILVELQQMMGLPSHTYFYW